MHNRKLNLQKMSTEGGYVGGDGKSISDSTRVKEVDANPPQEASHVDKTCAYPINMDHLQGYSQTVLTFNLDNTTGGTLLWGFGTPLMVPAERPNMGFAAADLFAGTAGAIDDLGAGALKTTGIALRSLRKNWIATRFDLIIDPTTAVGAAQRSQALRRNNFDLNLNECNKQGRLPISWTDFSAVVENVVVPIDEFNGFQYPILAGSVLEINVTIAALEVPTMSNSDGSCN